MTAREARASTKLQCGQYRAKDEADRYGENGKVLLQACWPRSWRWERLQKAENVQNHVKAEGAADVKMKTMKVQEGRDHRRAHDLVRLKRCTKGNRATTLDGDLYQSEETHRHQVTGFVLWTRGNRFRLFTTSHTTTHQHATPVYLR